ncbi:unnamed protein product [Nezara viridula]|uniref:Uncharacterized protein n=1 Tax=Nezara viridula TaxID=85310 RepID=A0A9P0H753_NEZVI|nr:unnamed protein product [Nezara viridula]
MHHNRSGRKYNNCTSTNDSRYTTIASEENYGEFEMEFIQPQFLPPVVEEYQAKDYSFYVPPYNCIPYVMDEFLPEFSYDWGPDLCDDTDDDYDNDQDIYEIEISSPPSRSISQNILNLISPTQVVDNNDEIPFPSYLYVDNTETNTVNIRYQRANDYYYYPQN